MAYIVYWRQGREEGEDIQKRDVFFGSKIDLQREVGISVRNFTFVFLISTIKFDIFHSNGYQGNSKKDIKKIHGYKK